jgi:ABC-type proline/glycine betaine transport system permease subunit
LGTPIIDGLVTNKPGFVLQGAVPLALLAVLLEMLFTRLEVSAAK